MTTDTLPTTETKLAMFGAIMSAITCSHNGSYIGDGLKELVAKLAPETTTYSIITQFGCMAEYQEGGFFPRLLFRNQSNQGCLAIPWDSMGIPYWTLHPLASAVFVNAPDYDSSVEYRIEHDDPQFAILSDALNWHYHNGFTRYTPTQIVVPDWVIAPKK